MKRALRLLAVAVLPALAMGCQNLSPAIDGPLTVRGSIPTRDENPVYIPLPKSDYGPVFESLLQVLNDYGFEIAESNRYSGHIEAVPRVAPGLALLLKPGSPDWYERTLATLQTYRHRVTIIIQPADPHGAEHGGYFIEFIVRKELEDTNRPIRSSIGTAVFRNENTVDRQTEVIDSTIYDPAWIYRGRDSALENELIGRFRCALARRP
jgi:hypothetical protein